MSDLCVDVWRDVQQLESHAEAWDNLWARTPIQQPACRSRPLTAWLQTFAAKSRVRILTVSRGSRLVAALPLVSGRYRQFIPVTSLARNSWSYAGELLLDVGHDAHAACRMLADRCRNMRTPLLRFEDVPYKSAHWQMFFSVMSHHQISCRRSDTFSIGTVNIGSDWEVYKANCSKNHRKKMGRMLRRLESVGAVDFHQYRDLRPDQVTPLLRCGFEMENQGWKGDAGTSALGSRGMFEFYLNQAKSLAADGCLCLSFLSCGGQPIAFEYGWIAKGTYFSPKVAYNPEFAKYSPGHLLLWKMFERFHADPGVKRVDFFGPTTDATSHWSTGSYPVGHITAAPSGLLGLAGKLALKAIDDRKKLVTEESFGPGRRFKQALT